MDPIWYLVIAGVIFELGFWYYLERLRHELRKETERKLLEELRKTLSTLNEEKGVN